MKRIGILGGTFNPIHSGHLLLAEGVREKLNLDYILFIPCCQPPHKKPMKFVSQKDRLAMVRLAVKGNPYFKASNIEIKRGGKSYSVDTLEELHRVYRGGARFFFIIGSDSLKELRLWKSFDRLTKLCNFVAVTRQDYSYKYKGVRAVKVPTLPISSTDIRNFVKQKKTIKYLVPEPVRRYILKNELYYF